MTLYKQIAILISLLLITILITILAMVFNSTREAAKNALYEDAQNSASTLSLSLATNAADESAMETMINASFDNGNYYKISLIDMDGELIYGRKIEQRPLDLPKWFVEFVKFKAPVAMAPVSQGWSVIGNLEVQSDTDTTYVELYKTLIGLIISLSILSIISLIILGILLHFVLRSLDKVRDQAAAILKNEFIIQKKLPYTTEFKDVVNGMNAMVEKVEDIFNKGNEALAHNKELLYKDGVTKLFNRRYFVLKTNEFLSPENRNNNGSLIMIALQDAGKINQALGHQKTDDLFRNLAKLFIDSTEKIKDSISARLNGTEFAVLLPQSDLENSKVIAEHVAKGAYKLFEDAELNPTELGVKIGLSNYSQNQKLSDLFSSADYALTQAKLLEYGKYYLYKNESEKESLGKEAWREIINSALEVDRFKILLRSVVDIESKKIPHDTTSFSITTQDDKTFYYGAFIAPVIGLGMLTDVYLYVINKILTTESSKLKGEAYSIQISSEFIEDSKTHEKLKTIFKNLGKHLPFRLIFEIPDSSINSDYLHASQFITLLKENNFSFGISGFMGDSDDYGYLKELKPLFIKADKSFLLDQSKQSLSTLQMVIDSLGIKLIATGVIDMEEVEKLKRLHVKTVQGSVVEKLL